MIVNVFTDDSTQYNVIAFRLWLVFISINNLTDLLSYLFFVFVFFSFFFYFSIIIFLAFLLFTFYLFIIIARQGEVIEGYVERVRDDGKIDVSIRSVYRQKHQQASTFIWNNRQLQNLQLILLLPLFLHLIHLLLMSMYLSISLSLFLSLHLSILFWLVLTYSLRYFPQTPWSQSYCSC